MEKETARMEFDEKMKALNLEQLRRWYLKRL